jgi:ankyrin repeat protein
MGVAANTVDDDGTPALLWASFAGDADTINVLLEGGAHLRTKHPLSPKALLIYLAEGIDRDQAGTTSTPGDEIFRRQRAVMNLIKTGADVNAKDLQLGTTLNAALRAVPNFLPATTIEELIKAGANVNTADELQRSTPLMWASQSGSVDAVQMLLKAGALVDVRDNLGRTPLIWAQVTPGYRGRSNPEVVSVLIDAGANVNASDPDGVTALILAARADLTESIKLLLAKGAQVNAKDRWGNSPLTSAFDSHYYAHADKDTVHHPTPLTIRTLLTAGADIHAGNSVAIPVLMLAARTNSLEALKMLLEAGAQINATDQRGRTVVMYEKWSYAPTVEVFRILLDAKADPNAVAPDGRTPLMFAMYGAPPEIIDLLLERGAKRTVNARDNSGQTALLHACYYKSFDFKPEDQLRIVKALIAAGADVNIKDNSGRTVLAVAQEYSRNEALIELLKSKQRN